MNYRSMQMLMSIILFSCAQTVFGVSEKIILKNNSAFDFVYKPQEAWAEVYKYGQSTPYGYEENIIPSRSVKMISIGVRRPLRLSIKRYGYGSSMSSWFDVPSPEDLAAELNPDQQRDYNRAIEQGKLPIITVGSSMTGGWSFTLGYVN